MGILQLFEGDSRARILLQIRLHFRRIVGGLTRGEVAGKAAPGAVDLRAHQIRQELIRRFFLRVVDALEAHQAGAADRYRALLFGRQHRHAQLKIFAVLAHKAQRAGAQHRHSDFAGEEAGADLFRI